MKKRSPSKPRALSTTERLIRALERIAASMEGELEDNKRSLANSVKQTEQLTKVQAIQEEQIRSTKEWRAEEREHMKVCAKRYERLVAGMDVDEDTAIQH